MARSEQLYLTNIVEVVDANQHYVAERTFEGFVEDDILRRAVLQRLIEIGEAASRLSAEFRVRHANIPWVDVIGFRNIAVHAYFAVDWHTVWIAATRNAPRLAEWVGALLDRIDRDPT
jgi:uncharacterized protein with HEPN domain